MGTVPFKGLLDPTVDMSGSREFQVYRDTLRRVEAFKYLGRWLSQEDSDNMAVSAQMTKARRA